MTRVVNDAVGAGGKCNMKSAGINFRLFGYIFNLQLNVYRSAYRAPVFHYGSTSNFGKWKVPPSGISNEYKPKKKRSR